MKFNRLGRTGLFVSELCMGTWGFSGRNYFGGAIGTLQQKDATQFAGTEYRQFFIGKFWRHGKRVAHACRLWLETLASSPRDESVRLADRRLALL